MPWECAGGKVCEAAVRFRFAAVEVAMKGSSAAPMAVVPIPVCGIECPTGQKCAAGACVDKCAGVMCPGGAACVNGACQMAGGGASSGGGTDGGIDFAGSLNFGGSKNSGTGNASGGSRRVAADPGCACEAVGSNPGGSALFLAGLGAALALGRRRRRAA